MPSTHNSDCQWLSVTEETLLLHDGLLRVTDLVQLPESVSNGDADFSEMRHVCFDSKDPSQLTKAILSVCGTDNNEFSKLVEYRMNALCGLWDAQRQIVQDEQDAKNSTTPDDTITILKKQGLLKDQEQASFSTRVSLLLILPILQSLSNSDKALCGVTAKVLLEALKDCPPFSLAREPEECLKGLENLLCDWIEGKCREETKGSKSEINRSNQEIAASALIALSCARGHLETFIHTVHLLQQCRDMPRLPVSDLLTRLLDTEGGAGQPSCFLGTRHMVTWGFEDLITSPVPGPAPPIPQLPATSSSNSTTAASGGDKDAEKDSECVRSIACDGYYVYTTSSSGYGLCKMGSGYHGTLRGYVYAHVQDVGPGRISWCNGSLLYRPQSFDSGGNQTHFAQLLNPATLQVVRTISRAANLPVSEGNLTTLAFCSDGIYLYHVWTLAFGNSGQSSDKTGKGLTVFADSFQFEESQQIVTILRPRIILQRKDDQTSRNLNETLLSRIRPYRASSVAQTLIALTGGETTTSKKDEGAAGCVGSTSSCGLSLKTLLKTPIYCEGNSFVLLSPLSAAPAPPATSAARSLFGVSTTGLSSLRSLASNLCFSAYDGQFTTRLDLADATGCALAAGTPLAKIGVCYDSVNNLLWMCSNEYVDEFSNPGHQAPQHIRHRLGLSSKVKPSGGGATICSGDIVHHLMQHVASMCIHQLHSDSLASPFASLLLHQCSAAQLHLARITNILETGISNHDNHTIVCSLIVLQLFFKMGAIKEQDNDVNEGLLDHTRSLLWHLLTDYRKEQSVKGGETGCCSVEREAGQVICIALNVLYPTPCSRHQLLNYLLTDAIDRDILDHLRDGLLVDLAEQLKMKTERSPGVVSLRLTGKLVQRVLNLAVRDSVQLVLTATAADRYTLQEMLSEIPRASPSVQYLCALQSFLLREILFCQPHPYPCPAGLEAQPATDAMSSQQVSIKQKSLRAELCDLAVRVLSGTSEVAEVLLKQCEVLMTGNIADSDCNSDADVVVSSVDRLVKGTVLGQLLPLLLTAMSHSGVQDLPMASQLTPLLANLLLLTTQTTLLMKAHMDLMLDKELELSSDNDVIGLIGETVAPAKVLQQQQQQEDKRNCDLLLGMKVPTPWASGRTVESIHPVRDNYKLKETVHIPGARCLYLRFDPRSSSQYDYDKLIVFAGPNTSCRKVSEYGGNTLGFGSRSVLGAGWPKDLVKVEGDTVTFSFEMRSGREHNTPDKAMWGFSVTVRAQESAEDVNGGLPLMADIALGLCNLTCSLLSRLYHGPPTSPEEQSCQHLLKAKILQRCVWRSDVESGNQGGSLHTAFTFSKQKLPRIKLSSELVHKLRLHASHPPIKMRPSIKKVLEPESLEERIVSVVIKHLGLSEAVAAVSQHHQPEGEESSLLSLVLQEVFRRTDSLIRQLQTLADLEQRWKSELEDQKPDRSHAGPPFFHDYHLHEMKQKELSMLCYLKDVIMDPLDKEHAVKMLMSKFECELDGGKEEGAGLWRTAQVVEAVTSRLDLLLHVSIAPPEVTPAMARSVSTFAANSPLSSVMVRSDTDVLQSSSLARSLSAPSGVDDDSVLEIIKLQRQRQARKKGRSSLLQDLVETDSSEKPIHVVLINQLFSFFGTEPETAISCEKFLKCAEVRWQRGKYRQKAFVHMKSVLSAAAQVGGATHLVSAVTSILRHGPRAEELTCGGMVDQVREAFAETMASVVELASKNPIANCSSITLLCTVPYTRADERCLVTSGLVGLLDQLCGVCSQQYKPHSTSSSSPGDNVPLNQHIPIMAWAGFQVLASRCVTWETEDGSGTFDKLEHSGLARQVSTLLTHYLTRATEGACNEAASTEALQDVLGLLNNLSRSHMGKAILSQPACVSKLLSLLLDQRPSPKLVLIIVQLCGVALPLLSESDCQAIQLPSWSHHLLTTHWNTSKPLTDTPAVIISLLLAKLGDFLVPGEQVLLSSRSPSQEASSCPVPGPPRRPGDRQQSDDQGDMQHGRLAVFIHKRTDQMSNEALQPLLSCENRLFRLSSGASVDKVMRMDKEINKHGKAEVLTEEAMSALRKAYKWAQSGLVMSTGCPSSQKEGIDKKKTASEEICRERNSLLARTDPVRPFISSQVANTMAAETISLLHNLLHSPLSSTAHTWAHAAYRVLGNVLSGLPFLLNSVEGLASSSGHYRPLMSTAKLANAALCALGGFEETIKPGCHVEVTGEGVDKTVGHVVSVVTRTEMATIQLESDTDDPPSPRYSDVMEVPLTRLRPIRNKMFLSPQPEMWETVMNTIRDILLPGQLQVPLPHLSLPVVGDGNSLPNQICRVVAEIQTRACTILSLYLQDINFAKQFIETCEPAVDILKSLAKDCSAGNRLSVMSMQCERLRMLYRDCVKPPPPPSEVENRANPQMLWEPNRAYPPVRACLFSQGLSTVTFLGDPSAGSSLPRGVLIYANQAIPKQAPSFYWEIELCSFGDVQGESSPVVSFGFAPAAEKKEGAWTQPVGSVLVHNSGKAVHYTGVSLLQWRSVRLDTSLEVGHVAGIGWERTSQHNNIPRGRVFFTLNGQRLPPTLADVAGALFPVVHIQKKNVRVRGNFGSRVFLYAEGHQHREAAEAASDLTREIRESFSHLPFHTTSSDSDSDETPAATVTTSNTSEQDTQTLPAPTPQGPTTTLPRKEYSAEESLVYKLNPSYSYMCSTGPGAWPGAGRGRGSGGPHQSEEEESEGEVEEEGATEDHYALLVRAWEQKVFPVVRRRFRNEAERKDGLEQIRGALQLGMTDIARQTVEFLYEENGGLPRDLHLPTMEDIKEDLSRFTIERVKKGKTVFISSSTKPGIPTYAVGSMMKTIGLAGTVLDIDTVNELVQVESYVQTEGVMVRFWYPISALEKPPKGFRKSSITGGQTLDTSTIALHREVVCTEAVLVRMLLRQSLLTLIDHCNSPAMGVSGCSTGLGAGMSASAAGLQELDIANLQLLSNHLLSCATPSGGLVHSALHSASSIKQCLASTTSALTDLLYSRPDDIKRELAIAIARAADQGEDYVIELTTQICQCLETAPEQFPVEELSVPEVKVSTDVNFPSAACLVVSCKSDPSVKKERVPYRSPWARIYTYSGKKVNKSGKPIKQEVMCYPQDNSGSAGTQHFEPVLIAGDSIHVKLGVSPPPGITLSVHALSPQFIMSVAYLETLITEKFGCGLRACQKTDTKSKKQMQTHSLGENLTQSSLWSLDNIVLSESIMFHAIELVCTYFRKTDVPAIIKEYMFHILAQSLRILHVLNGRRHGLYHKFESMHGAVVVFFRQLQKELKVLYSSESKMFQHGSTCSGLGMGLGVTDHGRFSSYFHALFEVNLAIAEVLGSEKAFFQRGPLRSFSEDGSTSSKSTATSKKKKLKPKKERERHQSVPGSSSSGTMSSVDVESSSSSDLLSESSLSSLSPSPSSSSTASSGEASQVDEMIWFRRAVNLSNILRVISLGEAFALSSLVDMVGDAARAMFMPTVHQRLIVLNGISHNLDLNDIKEAIHKACDVSGGVDYEDIYVPEVSGKSNTQSDKNEQGPSQERVLSQGFAVVNLPSKANVEIVQKSLAKSQPLIEGVSEGSGTVDTGEDFCVSLVNQDLLAEPSANQGLEHFLRYKLVQDKSDKILKDETVHAVTDIFYSCFFVSQEQSSPSERQETGFICLDSDQILFNSCENLLYLFFNSLRPAKKPLSDHINHVLRQYGIAVVPDKDVSSTSTGPGKNGKGKQGKKSPRSGKEKTVLGKPTERPSSSSLKDKPTKSKEQPEKSAKETVVSDKRREVKVLTLDGFLLHVTDMIRQDVRHVWKALIACGLDINLKRFRCLDVSQAVGMSHQWSLEMDAALVSYVNTLSNNLGLASARIHPHEISLKESQLVSEQLACLQDCPPESMRLRFALLQLVNNSLETLLLPLVDLRPTHTFSCSTAALLAASPYVLFYDTKVNFFNRVLNATAQRKADQAAPEITLDPLEGIGSEMKRPSEGTVFCQAFRQLQLVPSQQLCVRLASGGDPTYSFLVKLTGEEVHGTSGSFRQFLWQVAREVQAPSIGLLMPCPSASNGVHKGDSVLKPGAMTYQEEQLLQFFGQLLGVTIRADIPLGIGLLGTFWKGLLRQPLDPTEDLKQADIITYNYLKKIEMVETEGELMALCSNTYPQFVYPTLDGSMDKELLPNGAQLSVSWTNRQEYMDCIRGLRVQELMSAERSLALLSGLASIVPLQLLSLFTPNDLHVRTCGLPAVNLSFLKAHTMYQVGLMESDRHVQFFWRALEALSQEELCRFIKFACNQERIPHTCPCQNGGSDTAHVPPYPMKIAPPDGHGSPDKRYIRVETCMFMIKLPQYSSLEIMSQRLRYAIHCREDPLSG